MNHTEIQKYMKIKLEGPLPQPEKFASGIRRAPKREAKLSSEDVVQAIKNALRYIPEEYQKEMAKGAGQDIWLPFPASWKDMGPPGGQLQRELSGRKSASGYD